MRIVMLLLLSFKLVAVLW